MPASRSKQSEAADMQVDSELYVPGTPGCDPIDEPEPWDMEDIKLKDTLEVEKALSQAANTSETSFKTIKSNPITSGTTLNIPNFGKADLAERIARFESDLRENEHRVGKEKQADHRQDRRFNAPYQKQDDRRAQWSKEKRRLTQELGHAQAENRTLQRVNEELERELRGAREALAREQAHREEDRRLLHTRAKELRDTQTFLTKADVHSFAEIKKMVEGLNSEVLQIAAMMVDEFDCKGKDAGMRDEFEDMTTAVTQTRKILGEPMVQLLQDHKDKDMHIEVVQKSIQALLVKAADHFISRWSSDVPLSSFFQDMYDHIRISKNPAVAGRWRAMTRETTKYVLETDFDEKFSWLMQESLRDVLHRMVEKFGDRLDVLATLVKKLDRAIGEGITSRDLFVVAVDAGTEFDPSYMNAVEDGSGPIACSCDLGLGISATAEEGQQETRAECLVKVGVVYVSSFETR
ncbi:uncharacterized protein EV420DRAFT_1566346 [Desarmillaria tabescens]|uniref:Uncharacterized protein n=1 Tax=Armillaria tabescens TaxID=1929756 RepID=A0AA39JW81_ARMTA|nr:uncharacterized protein EV420DRAFT_1566346 [Desarmillaria tabescens]KAK0448950.1 hypothetical protein EV420DRAFT_1566346 [Desarmillaria tabescens]